MYGTSLDEGDATVAALLVLDTHAARLVKSEDPEYRSSAQVAITTYKCPLTVLDAAWTRNRPGLTVLQADWHPRSDTHLATLTSDGTFALHDLGHPTAPEQRWELAGSSGQGFGLHTVRHAFLRFAWGPEAGGWGGLGVLFLRRDGGVYALCPVAPFGSSMTEAAVQGLHAGLVEGDLTTEAWLQQAFRPLPEEESGGMRTVVCHALEAHSAALQGPLNDVEALDASYAASGGGANALCTTMLFDVHAALAKDPQGSLQLRTDDSAFAAVVIASAGAVLTTYLSAAILRPAWCEDSPVVSGGGASITYHPEAMPATGEEPAALLSMDTIDLPVAGAPAGSDDDDDDFDDGLPALALCAGGSDRMPLLLEVDPNDPCRVYAAHRSGLHLLELTWLSEMPALAKEGAVDDAADYPLPKVNALHVSSELPPMASAVVIGDHLSGTAALWLGTDASYACCWPPQTTTGMGIAPLLLDGLEGAKTREEAHRTAVYRDIEASANAPRKPLPPVPGDDAPQAEVLAYMNKAIDALQERAMLIHSMHHDVSEHLVQELRSGADDQEKAAHELLAASAQLTEGNAAIAERLAGALTLQENLTSRVSMLQELLVLNECRPQPLSAAERAFAAQLTDYEALGGRLQNEIDSCRRRIVESSALSRPAGAAGRHGTASAFALGAASPAAGAETMSGAEQAALSRRLEEQQATIQRLQANAALVTERLADVTAS